jgi:hypothetical protein
MAAFTGQRLRHSTDPVSVERSVFHLRRVASQSRLHRHRVGGGLIFRLRRVALSRLPLRDGLNTAAN